MFGRFDAEHAAGRPIGIALSGGGDSTALLHLAAERYGAEALRAATLDHGLRQGSAQEARLAAARCARIGIAHETLFWNGRAATGNLQDAARRARYTALARWARGAGIALVALGHTRDDNAETLLMGLSRGAGLDGLSGMRRDFTRDGCLFLRPLLDCSRAGLRAFLVERGLGWSEDPGNTDTRFDRIKARRALEAMAPLGIDAATLARSIANLRGSRLAIDERIAAWSRDHVIADRGDLLIDAPALGRLPDDLVRRLLGAGLRWISGRDYPPRAAALLDAAGALLAAENREAPPGRRSLHGCLLQVARGRLRLSREPAAALRAPARPAGTVWDGRWIIEGAAPAGAMTRALGEAGLADCPAWRETGLPRGSLLASPSLWQGDRLLAAPLARPDSQRRAVMAGNRDDFTATLLSH
ncbi:tRNA lysidine(34) synthetase TilS [Profundibacterium mesophilum]|uniref:tRNA(Ile)-lysidine synthase n=1 Tax=Profundibacterium mesophilum KAUST100406-0324 TaxID=1037889 RepID=A0A921TCJ7_9RHOB|nr:tRNA lysidine(34) synthetase TilS [Profundibacterium mesophilum]KAF0675748.1 tRNA-lysidine synthase [Profundibacterium mesophilum KAUST100406-0324]